MTAPQPPRDGEVCACGHHWDVHEQETLLGGRCCPDHLNFYCPCPSLRPAAPSEPPAEGQLTEEQR